MKLTTPFSIIKDAFKKTVPESPHCFIDDTEVSMQKCKPDIEEKLNVQYAAFWDQECEAHPTNSHCKVFDE